jgi:Lipocalin-like domain
MTRTMALLSASAFAFVAMATPAPAQSAKDLLGAWSLVSITVDQNGRKLEPYGSNPKGMQLFEANGRFAIIIMRPDLPKFAKPNRAEASADESQKVVHGSLAYYGSYAVDEPAKRISIHIDAATFPNWTGQQQQRTYAVSGDTLTIINPTPSIGAGTATVVWKRTPSGRGM